MPAEKKASRRGFFSALFGNTQSERALSAFSLDAYLAGLAARAPRVASGTMDDDGSGSLAKGAYRRTGEAISEELAEWYASHRFIGWQLCAILAQHWLINKACTIPVEDALRHGFTIVSDTGNLDAEELQKLKLSLRDYDVHRMLSRFLRKGRVFGLMIAIFHVDSDDPDYYLHPFNPDAVTPGSYRGITVVEPYWCAPQLSYDDINNPASPDFYNPTWWKIYDRLYHRSHLAIFCQDEVADILKPSYFYGGIPVPQKILSRVYAAERTADEAPALAMSKRTTILKTDSERALANFDEFMETLSKWIRLRDNFAVKVIDKEEEDLNQIDTTLTDFDTVMMGQYQLVAAAADVPATKLLGTSPKGFNATGEYEESSYHETLESLQEAHGTPFLEKHLLLAARSSGIRTDDLVLTVAWNPVDSPTAKEYADIRKVLIEHDVAAVEAGVLTPEQVLQRLYADENSGFTKPEDGAVGAGLEEMFSKLERQAATLPVPENAATASDARISIGNEAVKDVPFRAATHEEVQGLFDELSRMGERLSGQSGTTDAGSFNEADHPRDEDGKFGSGNGEIKPRGIARNSPSVVDLNGDELGQKEGESIKDAAKRYYEELTRKPAHREGFGTVNFYKGSGWSKFESTSKSDSEQLKLLPAVKPVIENGEYLGKAMPEKSKGNISAFHYFEANVSTRKGNQYIGVTVIEDKQGNKFYNLTKDPDDLYARKLEKKNGSRSPDFKTRDKSHSKDSASGTLDGSIADIGTEINILIL